MKNKRLLEYFEGNPDTVYDTTNQVTWKWDNEMAISFGYFPISLDNEYLFMTGSTTHLMIGAQAAKKLMGKAISHIKDSYIPWIERQCYGKSYCRGRIWTFDTDKYPSIMAFWYLPSSRMVRKIVNELNIDPYNYILVVEDSQNVFEENPTVAEYIESNSNGDDGFDEINEPFAIDKRVIEIIRSYNDTQKTWQTQKEKEGWKSLAQRNATLYQENRQRVDEYFAGDPDTIDEFDDVSGECMRSINYRDKNVISFGFFQTTLDGGKEFIYKTDICHHDICRGIAENIVGKAIASEDIEEGEIREIASSIYASTAYKGRIFLDANMITTWNRVSSSTLENLLNLMGGVEKWKHLSYIVPRWWDSNWQTDELSQKNINVVEYISQNITADETRDKYNMDRDFKPLVDEWLIDTIRQYNQPNSTLAAKTAKLGNMTIAQYNSLIHQEGKKSKETINEYYAGDPDTVFETDYDFVINWNSEDARCFGFFPVSLDGKYQFLVGYKTHQELILKALEKIAGKALNHVDKDYLSNTAIGEFYRNSYGLGRYWEKHNIIAFWNNPSFELLADVVKRLEIDEKNCYIIDGESRNIMVSEYLSAKKDGETGTIQKERPLPITKKNISIISSYNQPNETWQSRKENGGWKTLAQRNATIYQEKKEPKQTIKENSINMKDNKYQDYINIMSEALEKEDYKAYEYVKEMLDEAIEDSKHEKELMNEMNTTNFGVLNHIFENELPTLIKTNKKAVRNVIKTIKEDKNLITQFNFYNVIKEQYNGTHADMISSKDALENLAKIVSEDIDLKTVKASNKKLRNIMVESGIKPSDFVDEESRKLYENGDVILTTKRNTNNMISLVESYNAVSNWMDAHKSDKINDGKNPDEMIREFEEKLKNNLNESEMSFVQQITDWRSPIAEQRKEKLFNKFKNECINKINDMLKEDAENVELKGLSDQINEMSFNKETIVKDIAKLLEIRDILMDD